MVYLRLCVKLTWKLIQNKCRNLRTGFLRFIIPYIGVLCWTRFSYPNFFEEKTHMIVFLFGATPLPPSGSGPPHPRGFKITHNDAPQSVRLCFKSDQLVARPLPDNTQPPVGFESRIPAAQAAAEVRLWPHGHWDRHKIKHLLNRTQVCWSRVMAAVVDRGPAGTYDTLTEDLQAHRTDRRQVCCPRDAHPNAQRTAAPHTVCAALLNYKWPPYLVRCAVLCSANRNCAGTLSSDRLSSGDYYGAAWRDASIDGRPQTVQKSVVLQLLYQSGVLKRGRLCCDGGCCETSGVVQGVDGQTPI